ncbi:unnamed protein product [Diatraea saccharalis]|nr:unnamed protein product [Diatraea saccharalis]
MGSENDNQSNQSQNLTDDPDYVDLLSNKHRQPLTEIDNFEIQQFENINTPVYNTSTPIQLYKKPDDTRNSKKSREIKNEQEDEQIRNYTQPPRHRCNKAKLFSPESNGGTHSCLTFVTKRNLTDDPDYVDLLSNKHRQPLTEIDNFEIQQFENINTPVYNTSTPIQLYKKPDDTRNSKKTLLEILNDKPEGKMLLKLYQNEGVLDNNARNKLCNIIIKELLGNEPNEAKVTHETILYMARQIKDIFKKENISTYFIPYTHNKKLKIKRCAKGKLYDCLNNRKREYRAAKKKIICSNNMELEIAVGETSLIDTENIHKDLEWLRKSSEPWKIAEEKWKNTSKIRLEESKNITVSDYMNEYPVLKKPTGYQLLLIDFETLYPDKSQRLYETFILYRNKILDLAQKKANKNVESPINKLLTEYEALKGTSDNKSEEGSNIVVLMMLPLLLSSPLVKSKKSSWRPSKQESMEGFITHVPREMDILETITKRKEKFFKIGVTFQPTIVIVGPRVSDIKKYFVLVNNIFYTVHSILQAVDVCFKLYLALNCTYPIECENVWNLIQKGFYNIKTEWDKQYSSVNAFLTDLGISE